MSTSWSALQMLASASSVMLRLASTAFVSGAIFQRCKPVAQRMPHVYSWRHNGVTGMWNVEKSTVGFALTNRMRKRCGCGDISDSWGIDTAEGQEVCQEECGRVPRDFRYGGERIRPGCVRIPAASAASAAATSRPSLQIRLLGHMLFRAEDRFQATTRS